LLDQPKRLLLLTTGLEVLARHIPGSRGPRRTTQTYVRTHPAHLYLSSLQSLPSHRVASRSSSDLCLYYSLSLSLSPPFTKHLDHPAIVAFCPTLALYPKLQLLLDVIPRRLVCLSRHFLCPPIRAAVHSAQRGSPPHVFRYYILLYNPIVSSSADTSTCWQRACLDRFFVYSASFVGPHKLQQARPSFNRQCGDTDSPLAAILRRGPIYPQASQDSCVVVNVFR